MLLISIISSRQKILIIISYIVSPVIQNRTPGEPFLAKPAKEAEMEKMLKSMEVIYAFISLQSLLTSVELRAKFFRTILSGLARSSQHENVFKG